MDGSPFFDELETRDPHRRETELFSKLPAFLARLQRDYPGWRTRLSGIDAASILSRGALATLPLLRKSELAELQAAYPPFGGLDAAGAVRVFMSPGSIFDPQSPLPDSWGFARALYAAGFRAGEILHNCFSYHLSPGGFLLDDGARALGLTVFPAGPGNTEMQVQAIAHLRPAGYSGTPDYLKTILDKATELGRDVSSIKKALVSGGALFPSLREEYRASGVAVLQAYGTADLGCIAYESPALEGMIVNENMIVEIVRTGTSELAPEGEVGEVVVTTFNETYPLIRFATGDLSAIMPGRSACGRTNMRIRGWMGRADQTAKVKGMFVHPSQIAEIGRRHPGLGRLRLSISREQEQDVMTLKAESAVQDENFRLKVAETLLAVTKLKGSVEFAAPNSLPNDGKIIVDERPYDR
ncbi:MAG: AMP-binding protein [Rhodomicrobium sp.]